MTTQTFKILKHDARTLSWWNSKRDSINMSPSYQRESERWSTGKKQYLIDSILNGFDIPKIYLADFTWFNTALNERKTAYAVIDGKQRLESIFSFFDDGFGLSNEFSFRPDSSIKLSGLKYSEIRAEHPKIAEIFDNYNLDIMSVVTQDPSVIDDLFFRLNSSAPLSGAEIRNSITSKTTTQTREIGNHPFFKESAKFNKSQGQHLNSAAKIILFEMAESPQETKKRNLDTLARTNGHLSTSNLAKVKSTLDSMKKSFGANSIALKTEGQIPAYYWLFRDTPKKDHGKLARVIDEFTKALKGEPSKLNKKKKYIDEFKSASRSVNDRSSHETRIRILNDIFLEGIERENN